MPMNSASVEMVHIDSVRQSNEKVKTLNGLVVVFVGGTGGIGESTARELFRRATKPRAYIVGRNEERGNMICNELHEINSDGKAIFLQKDISLFKNIDDLCTEIKQRESKINCLFLTAGYLTLKGRNETTDGVDRKMAVNYYSRVRCILNLMPLLKAASEKNELSRVITVLAAGSEGDVRMDDLDLKHNFTLHACLAHCVVMTDFMIEALAKRYPHTSFSHSYPGTVKTGIANELTGPVRLAVKVLYAVLSPWILTIRESGERHLFQMTSACYPPVEGGAGVPIPDGLTVILGMNFQPGGGAYLLDSDGNSTGDEGVLRKYRSMGFEKKGWDHTMKMFQNAEQRGSRETKRPAQDDADGSGQRSPADPIGWRPSS